MKNMPNSPNFLIAKRSDRLVIGIFTLLGPPLAGAIALAVTAILHGVNSGPKPPIWQFLLAVIPGIILSNVFWGVPAICTSFYIASGRKAVQRLNYLKVSITAAVTSLVFTALGCLCVSLLVIDKVSYRYCIEHSIMFFKFLPPAFVIAAVICAWIVNRRLTRSPGPLHAEP
jgi:hypothetical protein